MSVTTWNHELAEALRAERYRSTPDPDGVVIAKAPNDETVWDRQFDNGFGGAEGAPVLAWTATRVYFPVVYDGAEWIESAPRNPQDAGQEHVGGQ